MGRKYTIEVSHKTADLLDKMGDIDPMVSPEDMAAQMVEERAQDYTTDDW